MPYIDRDARTHIGEYIENLYIDYPIDTAGELNYLISKCIHEYLKYKVAEPASLKYNLLNEVHGVLHCADMELYRTVTAPYENVKRAVNGPVSNFDL